MQKINWQKVWRAMHDFHYKQVTLSQAIELVREAGHPQPVQLAMRTMKYGYQLSRD